MCLCLLWNILVCTTSHIQITFLLICIINNFENTYDRCFELCNRAAAAHKQLLKLYIIQKFTFTIHQPMHKLIDSCSTLLKLYIDTCFGLFFCCCIEFLAKMFLFIRPKTQSHDTYLTAPLKNKIIL